ncbi:hypothetical protein [Streptomyces sp. CC208A]|uniref:hypothetical protein n=1 Tax=Streptomyces sp. CC208A TaxID=3044573 RepID=UPI0024A7EA8D|nr:hypothetical protein [Streptomyces sp. CC208A]
MNNPIVRLIAWFLLLLLPPTGRHRRYVTPPQPIIATLPTTPPALRGEESRLVRPYLVAHEKRDSDRLQRQRRRALWLAVHGIDVGPRLIHGVEVAR